MECIAARVAFFGGVSFPTLAVYMNESVDDVDLIPLLQSACILSDVNNQHQFSITEVKRLDEILNLI